MGPSTASSRVWKEQDDDGSLVGQVNATTGSGTQDKASEYYWTVTSRDGTQYDFGRNRLPGWTSGDTPTGSVETEPIYAPHSGDPCYNATFSASHRVMAYRWNLDYVVDGHGNAMADYYHQDTNYYGRFNGAMDDSYIRDAYLDHIDYGFNPVGPTAICSPEGEAVPRAYGIRSMREPAPVVRS